MGSPGGGGGSVGGGSENGGAREAEEAKSRSSNQADMTGSERTQQDDFDRAMDNANRPDRAPAAAPPESSAPDDDERDNTRATDNTNRPDRAPAAPPDKNRAMVEAIDERYGPPPEINGLEDAQQAGISPAAAGVAAGTVAPSLVDDAARVGLKASLRALGPIGIAIDVFTPTPVADGTLGPNNPLNTEITNENTEESGKKAAEEERQKHIDKGIPESALGPSGKPKRHSVDHSGKKEAKEAAKEAGKGEPMHHPSPNEGDPHYHPTDTDGDKQMPNVHHNYPKGR